MENWLNSLETANHLVKKIDSLCKDIEGAIAQCMELTGDKVATHSVTLTHKMDTEFVDTVVIALHNMKNHLEELKKNIRNFKSHEEMQTIIHGLMSSSDNLQLLLNSNNFFHNTFQLLVSEVQVMIDSVLEHVELVPMEA